jgi:hypothetical protein
LRNLDNNFGGISTLVNTSDHLDDTETIKYQETYRKISKVSGYKLNLSRKLILQLLKRPGASSHEDHIVGCLEEIPSDGKTDTSTTASQYDSLYSRHTGDERQGNVMLMTNGRTTFHGKERWGSIRKLKIKNKNRLESERNMFTQGKVFFS